MRLIQEIGSYAGLAAIPGLAVLSALYFSQARDVRRLREWAGRAPERAAEQASGGRQAQPAARPATAAARVAQPAVVRQGGNGADAQRTAEAQRTAAKPAALTPAAVASAAAQSGRPGAPTGTVARPGAPAGALPRKQIPSIPGSGAGPGATAIRPSWDEPKPWYRSLADRLPAGRYVALIVVGALVLGGGAAYGISQLSSSDNSTSVPRSALQPAKGKRAGKKSRAGSAPAIDPSKVTVTVVNGTTVPNLARDTASKLSGFGFQIGNKVTGTGSLAAAESVVEYRPGAQNAAKYVASKLHISQTQPADTDALAQAGPAQVIVVAGANLAPGG